MRRLRAAILTLFLAGFGPLFTPLSAQEAGGPLRSPVLTIDQERLFTESRTGKALVEALEAESAELAAENRRIEAELIAEERDLTARRPELPAEEFRALAEEFDQKVVAIRRAQDNKARSLSQRSDADRQAFYRRVLPLVAEIVRDRGGVVVLERGAVILSAEQVDITDAAIAQIDAQFGADAVGAIRDGAPQAAPGATEDQTSQTDPDPASDAPVPGEAPPE